VTGCLNSINIGRLEQQIYYGMSLTAYHMMYCGSRHVATVGIVGGIVAHGEDMGGSTSI
jgi:hypothetical protein